MTVVSADLGLLPDADVLRPRVWVGNTAKIRVQFRDDARRPVEPPGPVVFLWKTPGNVVLELPGVPVPGKVGAYDGEYQPPSTGTFAVRADGGGDGPTLRWTEFVVEPEPPEGSIPQQSIWLTAPDTAAVSIHGTHLAGATIPQFPAKATLEATDTIPGVDADGNSVRLPGNAVIDAALATVAPAVEQVTQTAATVATQAGEVAGNAQAAQEAAEAAEAAAAPLAGAAEAVQGFDARLTAIPVRKAAAGLIGGLETTLAALDAKRRSIFRFGPMHLGVAGLWVQRYEDGRWALSGPRGTLVEWGATGKPTYTGLPVRSGTVPGAHIVQTFTDGRFVAARWDQADGALRMLGRSAGTTSGDFSAADVATYDAEATAYSDKVARRDVSDLHQPTEGVVLFLGYGQSLSAGWEAWPALSTNTTRLDNLMMGASVHPDSESGAYWSPVGGSAVFQPMKATVRNGINGASAGLLSDGEVAALAFGAANLGETPLEGALNHFRAAWLRVRGKPAGDAANQFVAASCGVGGKTAQQLSKGQTPEYFNRVREAIRKARAQAIADGKTFGVGGVLINQGENDYSGGTTFETYVSLATQLIADIRATVLEEAPEMAGTGTVPVYLFQTGGQYANDALELAIARAQTEVARTVAGVFIVSGNGPVPDKGDHLTSNGSRQIGEQAGKVMVETLINRRGWENTRPIRWVTRGTTLLGLFHAPVAPIRYASPYEGRTVMNRISDWGLYVADASGAVGVQSVKVVSGRVLSVALARAPAGTTKVWIGRKATMNGGVFIADSDPTGLLDAYRYMPGSGQTADENITDLAGLTYSAANFSLADVQTATAS